MQVYLLRHGIAEEGSIGVSDADRELTQEGRRKLRQVLLAAAKAGTEPTLILSSPLKRAIQSAEIASDVFKYRGEVLRTKSLSPSASVENVWDEIRVHKGEDALMLVGHNPLFSDAAAYLLGSKDVQIEFKKGSILRIDFEQISLRPRGILRWYLTPKTAGHSD